MKLYFSRILAVLAVLLSTSTFMVSSPLPAQAADEDTKAEEVLSSDQLKRYERLSDDDKTKLRDEVLHVISKDKCGDFWYYTKMEHILSFQKRSCEEQTTDALKAMYPTADALILGQGPEKDFCDALTETKASAEGIKYCIQNKVHKQVWGWTGEKLRGLLEQSELGRSLLNFTDAIDNTVKFIADPKSQLDEVANSTKAESVAMTTKVLEELTSTTDFNPTSDAFKAKWAVYAGLGVVGVGVILMWLFHQHGNGDISDEDTTKSLQYFLPAALFLVIYTPWLMGWVLEKVKPLTDGTTDWAAEAISNFVTVVARFGAVESTSWFGPIAAIVFFGLLFIGAIALLIFFLLVPIFQALMGFAIAMLIGMLISPKTRRYVVKVGSVLVSMVILKPLAFLVMGGVFWVLASQPAFTEGTDDLLVNVGNLGATAVIMLMLVISPAAMFRWMPVMESRSAKFGGISPEISAGIGGAAGAVIGSGASSVRKAISNRRNAASSASSIPNNSSGSATGQRDGISSSSSVEAGLDSSGSAASTARADDTQSSGTNDSGGSGMLSNPRPGMLANAAQTKSRVAEQDSSNSSDASNTNSASTPEGTGFMGRASERVGNRSKLVENRSAGADNSENSNGREPSEGSFNGSKGTNASTADRTSETGGESKIKKASSLTGLVATAPITAGTVGLLAGAQRLASNAAIQARLAAENSDPDDWDSFKDR